MLAQVNPADFSKIPLSSSPIRQSVSAALGAGQISSGTPFCRINAAFHLTTERRIYAAAKNSSCARCAPSEQSLSTAEEFKAITRYSHENVIPRIGVLSGDVIPGS